jgi:hypothetical protein
MQYITAPKYNYPILCRTVGSDTLLTIGRKPIFILRSFPIYSTCEKFGCGDEGIRSRLSRSDLVIHLCDLIFAVAFVTSHPFGVPALPGLGSNPRPSFWQAGAPLDLCFEFITCFQDFFFLKAQDILRRCHCFPFSSVASTQKEQYLK